MKLEYINKDNLCPKCKIGHLIIEITILRTNIFDCVYCGARFKEK